MLWNLKSPPQVKLFLLPEKRIKRRNPHQIHRPTLTPPLGRKTNCCENTKKVKSNQRRRTTMGNHSQREWCLSAIRSTTKLPLRLERFHQLNDPRASDTRRANIWKHRKLSLFSSNRGMYPENKISLTRARRMFLTIQPKDKNHGRTRHFQNRLSVSSSQLSQPENLAREAPTDATKMWTRVKRMIWSMWKWNLFHQEVQRRNRNWTSKTLSSRLSIYLSLVPFPTTQSIYHLC